MKTFKDDTIFKQHFNNQPVCLYGEGHGLKIQAGGERYVPDGVDFVIFDILINNRWLTRPEIYGIAKTFGLKTVPVVGAGTLLECIELVKNGFSSKWGDFPAEGIVARPAVELRGNDGERIIAKIKHKDFL